MVIKESKERNLEEVQAKGGTLVVMPNEWFQLSRNTRRLRVKKDPSVAEPLKLASQLKVMENSLRSSWQQLSAITSEHNRNLTSMVYNGPVHVYQDLVLRMKIGPLLNIIEKLSIDSGTVVVPPQVVSAFSRQDFYSHKVANNVFVTGFSLEDIAQMEPPLTDQDKKKIDRTLSMFNPLGLLSSSVQNKDDDLSNWLVRQSLVILASQKMARPEEKVIIPEELVPLYERMIEYFDYYTDNLLNPDPSFLNKLNFFMQMGRTRPWLPHGLGMYLPARLGITPSSSIKLMERLAIESGFVGMLRTPVGINIYESATEKAIRKNALSPKMQPFAYYDKANEMCVEKRLEGYFKITRQLVSGQVIGESEQIFSRLGKYNKLLREGITSSQDQALTIPLPTPDGLLQSLHLTSHNRNNLMVVAGFSDNGHLTLEIGTDLDGAYRLYGVPAELDANYSLMPERFIKEFVAPIVSFAAEKYPRVETPYRVQFEAVAPYIPASPKGQLPGMPKKWQQVKERPKKGQTVILENKKDQVVNEVIYSEDELLNYLPKKGTKLKEQFEEAIEAFKNGQNIGKPLYEIEGRVIRVGHYRIAFEKIGDHQYRIYAAGHRSGFYNKAGLSLHNSGE